MTTLIPKFDLKNGSSTPTGAVNRPINEKLEESLSVLDFGAVADGVTDNSVALQNAINASEGKALYFPSGVYVFNTTLIFKNNTIYYGNGKNGYYVGGLSSVGTILKYTGTSDAIQINNPINSSTEANIVIQDMYVYCTQTTTGKAAIADVGSTFLDIIRVGVFGNFYGIVLDQSELVTIQSCEFNLPASNAGAGLWLVNGSEHTVGALEGYTNRIDVNSCQFLSPNTSGLLIEDDGGASHNFINNNYQGGQIQIRVNAVSTLTISGSEFEGFGTRAIQLSTTKGGGAAGGYSSEITISQNIIINGDLVTTSPIIFDNNSVTSIIFNNNLFNTPSTVSVLQNAIAGASKWSGVGNTQAGAGLATSASLGNNYNIYENYTPVWTSDASQPSIGNGVLAGTYIRSGNQITANISLVAGSTTNFGTGAWYFTLPSTSANFYPTVGTAQLYIAGAYYSGICFVLATGSFVQISFNGSANLVSYNTPATWATNNFARITITYAQAITL